MKRKILGLVLITMCLLIGCGEKTETSKSQNSTKETIKDTIKSSVSLDELNKHIGLSLPEFLKEINISEVFNDGFNGYQKSEFPNRVDNTGRYLYKYSKNATPVAVDLEKSLVSPQSLGSVSTTIDGQEVGIIVKNDTLEAIPYNKSIVVGYICYKVKSDVGTSILEDIKSKENFKKFNTTYSYLDNNNRIHIYMSSDRSYIYGEPYQSFVTFSEVSTYDDIEIKFTEPIKNYVNYESDTKNLLTEFTMGNNTFKVSKKESSLPGTLSAEGYVSDKFYATNVVIENSEYPFVTGIIYDGLYRMTEKDFNFLQTEYTTLSEYTKVTENDTCSVYIRTKTNSYKVYVFNKIGIAWEFISFVKPEQQSIEDLTTVILEYNDIINRYISK